MRTVTRTPNAPDRRRRGWTPLLIALGAIGLVAGTSVVDAQSYSSEANRCQKLERQLVSEWQRGNSPQEAVARIDQQLQTFQRQRRKAEVEADKRECYETLFIFGRSLKRTKACIKLDRDIERLRRDISTLRQRREAMTNSQQRRMRRDELVAELARYGCGENYEREYSARQRRNSFFSLWEDQDTSFDRGYANKPPEQSDLPFASYRTMCVRLCDGFYFPISFSTLGSRFTEDEAQCKSQCAAPAELYVYKNPGEDVEQMVSLSGQPYNNLKNAWRHRKEYIKGCSCKPEEYSAHQIMLSEQENKQAGVSPQTSGGGASPSPSNGNAGSPAGGGTQAQ